MRSAESRCSACTASPGIGGRAAELAIDITQHAYRITAEDLARVRSHGWDEPQLLEAVWVACLFNAIVRLADTFGLRELGELADDRISVASPG